MKQALFAILLSTFLIFTAAAQKVNVFHERQGQTTTIYATNPEFYPASVSLTFDLTNMDFSEGSQRVFVVPAQSVKFKIGELKPAGNVSYKFSYNYRTAMGDVTKKYDQGYVYDLPFQKGQGFRLFQGYNGKLSHTGENSLDFTMPEGTEILAAREGTVVEVVQQNNVSCPRQECEKFNNYIMILHPDGTFANYVHIKQNGARFKPGDKVKKGDVIAYSGNVGWSSGPHLHFICFTGGFDKWQSIETRFRINKGDVDALLQEGGTYTRDY